MVLPDKKNVQLPAGLDRSNVGEALGEAIATLRSSCTTIIGFSEIARDGIFENLSGANKKIFESIVSAAHQPIEAMDKLIDDMRLEIDASSPRSFEEIIGGGLKHLITSSYSCSVDVQRLVKLLDFGDGDSKNIEYSIQVYSVASDLRGKLFKEQTYFQESLRETAYATIVREILNDVFTRNTLSSNDKIAYADNNEAQNSSLEAPEDLSESALEKTDGVSPAFEGVIDKEFAIDALKRVHADSGLSERKFAEQLGVSRGVFRSVIDGNATIDKATDLLRAAGYGLQGQLVRLEVD